MIQNSVNQMLGVAGLVGGYARQERIRDAKTNIGASQAAARAAYSAGQKALGDKFYTNVVDVEPETGKEITAAEKVGRDYEQNTSGYGRSIFRPKEISDFRDTLSIELGADIGKNQGIATLESQKEAEEKAAQANLNSFIEQGFNLATDNNGKPNGGAPTFDELIKGLNEESRRNNPSNKKENKLDQSSADKKANQEALKEMASKLQQAERYKNMWDYIKNANVTDDTGYYTNRQTRRRMEQLEKQGNKEDKK